jgi:hypothetical protein
MTDDGRRLEHLKHLYAKHKRCGESFDAYVARVGREGHEERVQDEVVTKHTDETTPDGI